MKKQIHANTHSRHRILALVLAFCLLAALLPAVSLAEISGDFEYKLYEYSDGSQTITGVSITKYTGSGSSVSIPASLGGYPVIDIGESVFESRTALESVVIPDGIISIGDYAFMNSANLANVTIPNSVVHFGYNVFLGTAWLASHSGDTYLVVGNDVLLKYNGSGTTAVVPNNVRYIADAFKKNANLTSVTIPNSVISIGDWAFEECANLTSVTIPNSVTSIGMGAFCENPSLKSITIPDSVKTIGNYVFTHCTGLESVTLPNGISDFGDEAFSGCVSLKSITIPNSVTSIDNTAFYDCRSLERITIPKDVSLIGSGAFSRCANLKEVYFEGLPPVLEENWEGAINVFDDAHPSLTLYYPTIYATAWASDGEDTWNGYKIAPYVLGEPTIEYGDPTGDGKITAADAALILRYIVKLDPLSGAGLANADANGDGKITAADAALVLRFIVKLENKLGPR